VLPSVSHGPIVDPSPGVLEILFMLLCAAVLPYLPRVPADTHAVIVVTHMLLLG
jgi:hypothetical protein